VKKEKEREKKGEKKTIFFERGSIQNPEKLSDNGKEDSSGKGGTRRKKGHREFEFQQVYVEKGKLKNKGIKEPKKTKTKENSN